MQAPMNEPKLLVPVREAAAMLSIGVSTFYQRVKDGKLPKPVHIGASARWRVSDIKQHFAAQAS